MIPNAKAVDRVIQQIQAELLEDRVISETIVGLVSLLERSYQIKKHFSAQGIARTGAYDFADKEDAIKRFSLNSTQYFARVYPVIRLKCIL